MNKEQLLDLTERVKLVAGVKLPVIVGSQSLYAAQTCSMYSRLPDLMPENCTWNLPPL